MENSNKFRQEAARPSRRRILLIAMAALIIAAAAVIFWYIRTYTRYDVYRSLLQNPAPPEEAAAFRPLEDSDPQLPGFSLAAENDLLKLYVKPNAGEFAVYDKRDGHTLFSNPQDIDSDPIANGTNKDYLRSQFVLEYYNAASTEGSWDSWSMSSALGQVETQAVRDGVRFTYRLGKREEIKYLVPTLMSAACYEALVRDMNDSDRGQMEKFYLFSEEDGLYRLSDNGRSNVRSRAKLDQVMQAHGFTLEDYYEQEALSGSTAAEQLSFTIVLECRLREDAVEVTMPVSLMEEFGGGQIRRVQLLRYIGAAGAEEEGDIVLPAGSGALLHFNNGKSASPVYAQNIYEMDLVDADYTKTQNSEPVRLALWGLCRKDSGLLCTVERGASLASITADTAGRSNSYNFAYPSFTLRGSSKLTMFGTDTGATDALIIEKGLVNENITVRYTLLDSAHAGYAGLAAYQRERLLREGVLKPGQGDGDIPFYYDVIGGVKETAHFLGIQYLRVLPMTTFAQAEQMVTELKHLGISRQVMNLQGWMNGGYFHDAVSSVKVLPGLGGEAGLSRLNRSLQVTGGILCGDVALQKVTGISRHFRPSAESSRYYAAGYVVELGVVNPLTLRRTSTLGYSELSYSLLSPKFLPRYTERFLAAARRLDMDGISLRDLGDDLHSDKKRTAVITREQALDVVRASLDSFAASGRTILLSGGNDYAFGAARHIINAPMSSTSFFILDESIPLWQMILHGSVDYAGSALNMASPADRKLTLLHCVEYGASCHYTFTWRDAAEMKYTGLSSDYATTFSRWAQEAAESYAYINGALRNVSGAAMTGHERLSGELVRTVYDNGVTIYVNYGTEAAESDGFTVPPMDYLVTGGEGA